MKLQLFYRWQIKFGVLSKKEDGGDYVSAETTIISKSNKDLYGVVFWNRGVGEFNGSIINYLPSEPDFIHPAYSNGGEMTSRGFRLQREPEIHYQGAVRIINIQGTDPLGQYELDVAVNGKVIKTIKYTVTE